MHAPKQSSARRSPPRGRPPRSRYRDPTAVEQGLLRLLSEQGAVPLDQVARFIEGELADATRLLQGLDDAGCIEHRRFLVRDYPWFWPTRRGVRLARLGFAYKPPEVIMLAHRRAVNDVRLHLRDRAPHGYWVCERAVYHQRDFNDHLPDAVLEVEGERHAIEAELSTKGHRELRRILAEHSNRYDAVIYFCAPRPYSLLRRVKAEGCWPKLVVRRMSEAEPC
jgi:hypothetical protein